MKPTRTTFAILALILIGCFAFVAEGVMAGRWDQWNLSVLGQAEANHSPDLTGAMKAITAIGGRIGSVAVLVLGVLVLLARGQKWDAVLLVVSLAASTGLELLLKGLFAVPRPTAFTPLVEATGFGFPSGHATRSAALFGYLAGVMLLGPGRLLVRVTGLILFAILAVAVSVSRVYLGVHNPTDVIGGMMLGVACVCICLAVRQSGVE